jgi:hypothetical protein
VSVDERPVHLVLDTTAIVAFAAGSIPVGELIAEIDDENGVAGLPVLCLAEASRFAADSDRLTLLANHHATVLLSVPAGDWRALAITTDEIIGRVDAASAVLAAYNHDCEVLTATPRLYAGLDGDMILPIEE